MLLSAQVDEYRRGQEDCQRALETWIGPGLKAALGDVDATSYPPTFPRRDDQDDKAHGVSTHTTGSTTGKRARAANSSVRNTMDGWEEELKVPPGLLPSAYHSAVREHPAMKAAADTELELLKGKANQALGELRVHLTTYQGLQDRKREVSGTVKTSAIDRRLNAKKVAINRSADKYRDIRIRLRLLGMPENDKELRPLKDTDVRPYPITAAETRIGDSHNTVSWLWGDFAFIGDITNENIKNFVLHSELPTILTTTQSLTQEIAVRVHWCRSEALRRRWQEEVATLDEEMYRTVRTYKTVKDKWLSRAKDAEGKQLLGKAAYCRRYALEESLRRGERCSLHCPQSSSSI